MSETEIIRKLQQGNEQAFKELVENYQKLVVNTCFGMVHNIEDAEDIAQEVFIEVFRSIHKFRADSKLSTWLYRMSVNRSLNFIRDNKRSKWFQSFEDSVQSKNAVHENLINKNTDHPGFELENSQRAKLLHEAIDSLPQNQKVAFTLSKYEELSYQEISGVMELSVSSVESLIHRAKKNLQKKLYVCYKKRCI
ncbi:MAG: sigma-70 family RNA polymerase sigma factor [Prolixibacteraceae bacterium]|jgi:RNA polymerase sigma-70 factor, ECF subfamily|nr:sigma-70 family RNA polymerase sigma factor [Prolixibacteraceae bacterium]MBT6004294.1 sigma-70 family RNA polymerase sigma factor [Prolixibacteraceae bacterium]MBT6767331.1 sigma-70 family RNA polymerase sigma factor [Prolixibacteraceae bacterium]MBT7000129.1 sigma-70 family RNA polymerase sigma factor [Prolixibacteraceae bacterium]MBT7397337.1 sigma-70 family RNA polymerase sigma factor [Prolixibacteraceae bacterium]